LTWVFPKYMQEKKHSHLYSITFCIGEAAQEPDGLLTTADASEEILHVPHLSAVAACGGENKEAAPVLRHFVSAVPAVVRPYFGVTPASPLTTFEQEVARHPVFCVTSASEVRDGRPIRLPP
jgi:hypothetical protein